MKLMQRIGRQPERRVRPLELVENARVGGVVRIEQKRYAQYAKTRMVKKLKLLKRQ
jgi:hypothetical protein